MVPAKLVGPTHCDATSADSAVLAPVRQTKMESNTVGLIIY